MDWPNDEACKHALPIAVLTPAAGESELLERDLLVARIDDAACPVFLWTERSFFPLFASLAEFVAELSGKKVNPVDALKTAIAAAQAKHSDNYSGGAAELLEAAAAPLGGAPSSHASPERASR